MENELCYLSITEAAAALSKKTVSSVELTEACLRRIEAVDGQLHSFITLTADRALAQALQADQELRSERCRGPS